MEPVPEVLERLRQLFTTSLGLLGETAVEVQRLEKEKKEKRTAITKQRDQELAAVSAEYDPLIAEAMQKRDKVKNKLLFIAHSQLHRFYKPRTTKAVFDTGEIQYTIGQPSMVVDDEQALRADLRKRKLYLKFTQDAERPIATATLKSALLEGNRKLKGLKGVRITRTPEFIFRPGKFAPSTSISAGSPHSDTQQED